MDFFYQKGQSEFFLDSIIIFERTLEADFPTVLSEMK